MEWGLKAGGNYFKVGGRSFDNTYNLSFSGGAYAEINYSKYFTLQPELLFNQVLCKTSQDLTRSTVTMAVSVISWSASIISPFRSCWPTSQSRSCRSCWGHNTVSRSRRRQDLLQDYAKSECFFHSDFSLVFGGQLNIGKIKVGLRYQEGLVNINAINSTDAWRTYGLQAYFAISDQRSQAEINLWHVTVVQLV